MENQQLFYLNLTSEKNSTAMDNYVITLGTYLVLMLFFKVFVAVADKE